MSVEPIKNNYVQQKRIGIIISLILCSALTSIDQDIVSTSMPTISKELGTPELYGWVFTAYMITSTIALIIFSRLSDFYGTKFIFILGQVVFLLGSVLSGFAASMVSLILFRLIQGVGGGILIVLPMIIVAQIFPKEEWGKWQGVIFAAFGMGNLLGPVLGGFITEYIGWRWIFWMNIPIILVGLLLVFRIKGEFSKRGEITGRFDVKGSILFIVSLSLVLVAIDQFKNMNGLWIGGVLFIAGLITGLMFYRKQFGVEHQLIPFTIFKDKTVLSLHGIAFLISFSMIGAAAYVPLYIQNVKGHTPSMSGLIMLPIILAAIVSSVVAGVALNKTRNPKVVLISVVMMLFVPLAMITTVDPGSPILLIIIYGTLLGVGIGGSLPVLTVFVQSRIQSNYLSMGTSMLTFIRTFGATAGLTMAGAIISTAGDSGLMGSLKLIFLVETGAALLAVIMSVFLIQAKSISMEPPGHNL